MERHPTEKVGTAAFAEQEERRNLQQMSVMYGSHFAMRAVMDRSIMAQATRGAGERSNHFGLHSALDHYSDMAVNDIYNDAYEQPEMSKDSANMKAEKIYGM